MGDVNATIGNISVRYSYELLVVDVHIKKEGSDPTILRLSYSEALILSDLLNFVMPHTSRVRVRKSMSP